MKKRILIVDDENDIVEFIQRKLQRSGYDTFTAVDGNCALDVIRQHEMDLILTDVTMPVMGGDIFCQKLKEFRCGKNIPVIVSTGHDVDKGFFEKLGIHKFIQKPFSGQFLLDAVNAIFRKVPKVDMRGQIFLQTREKMEIEKTIRKIIGLGVQIKIKLISSGANLISESLKKHPDVIIVDIFSRDIPCAKIIKMLHEDEGLDGAGILVCTDRGNREINPFFADKHMRKRKKMCLREGISGFVERMDEATLSFILAEFCLKARE